MASDATRAHHGGDVIGERLVRRGVEFLFTLCGGHISPILVAAKARGIRVVDVRDEANAVFAADAVARMTGVPGVAAVTAGPGVTNSVTAVKNAQMAQSPLVIFGGTAATMLKGRGALQDIDQLALMRPITKWATAVKRLAQLGPVVDKAFDVAQADVPGPVFVEVPVDLLYPESVVRDWYLKESGAGSSKGLGARALELYLRGHLYQQFHAPHVAIDLPRPRVRLPRWNGHAAAIAQAARLVAAAQRPVLLVGSQALARCRDPQGLAAAVETLSMPTFLAGMARGLLRRNNPIQARHHRNRALKEADLVIVAGFPFDFRLNYGRSISSRATLVAANLSAQELRMNRSPDVGCEMHPGDFLSRLAAAVGPRSAPWPEWFATVREREEGRDREIAAQAKHPDSGLVNPLELFVRLEEKMAEDAVLIVDGGDFAATAAYILRPRAPLCWLDPGVFGTLGVGGGFALGAALCRPGAEIWLIYGDGSCAYSLAEFDTFVRHGLAPIAIVGTDGSWAQIAREQVEILGDDIGTVLARTPYEKVAEGYGGAGLLLRDRGAIDDTLDRARQLARAGKPVLVNVHIAATNFRKGSVSM